MKATRMENRFGTNSPADQRHPSPYSEPMAEYDASKIPPLSWRLAMTLRPLTKEGRRCNPLWYLTTRPHRIRQAPPGSPLGEKVRRRCEYAANVLWWPIARVLTLFFLWRDGLDHRVMTPYFAARGVATGDRIRVQCAEMTKGQFSSPSGEQPAASVGQPSSQESSPECSQQENPVNLKNPQTPEAA